MCWGWTSHWRRGQGGTTASGFQLVPAGRWLNSGLPVALAGSTILSFLPSSLFSVCHMLMRKVEVTATPSIKAPFGSGAIRKVETTICTLQSYGFNCGRRSQT